MKQAKLFYIGLLAKKNALFPCGMTEVDVIGILGISISGIIYHQVCTIDQLQNISIQAIWFVFGIGHVAKGTPVKIYPVCRRATGMVELAGFYLDIIAGR